MSLALRGDTPHAAPRFFGLPPQTPEVLGERCVREPRVQIRSDSERPCR